MFANPKPIGSDRRARVQVRRGDYWATHSRHDEEADALIRAQVLRMMGTEARATDADGATLE